MKAMFPKQLLAMKNGHEKFMNELEERLNNWKWQGVLGDIFTKLGNSYHVSGGFVAVCLLAPLFTCELVCLFLSHSLFFISYHFLRLKVKRPWIRGSFALVFAKTICLYIYIYFHFFSRLIS